MNKRQQEISISIPSYETGSKPIPTSLLAVWKSTDQQVRNDMTILAYEDETLHEIRYVSPNILACPNTEIGIENVLEDVKEDRRELFTKMNILDNRPFQLAFIIYHEYKHFLQDKDGRLKRFQQDSEVKVLETEADEFATQKVLDLQKSS